MSRLELFQLQGAEPQLRLFKGQINRYLRSPITRSVVASGTAVSGEGSNSQSVGWGPQGVAEALRGS